MQPLQGFLHPLLPVPGVVRFNLRLQCIQIQSFRPRQVLVADSDDPLQSFGCRLEDGGGSVQGRFLGHKCNPHSLLYLERAVVWFCQAAKNFEKRGFACAIAADQADTFRSLQRKASVVQQCNMPKCELGVQ
ncbi:hypothetical protein D3C71_1230580 [compost metagenome]